MTMNNSQEAIIKELQDEITRNNRVCFLPQQWHKLNWMLPKREEVGGEKVPPNPLILAG